MALHVARHLESPQVPGKAEEVASPPWTPISLSNLKPVSNVSEVASKSSPIQETRGGEAHGDTFGDEEGWGFGKRDSITETSCGSSARDETRVDPIVP
ncbi:hypothetical protein ACFX19_033913 [Malus domestica]